MNAQGKNDFARRHAIDWPRKLSISTFPGSVNAPDNRAVSRYSAWRRPLKITSFLRKWESMALRTGNNPPLLPG